MLLSRGQCVSVFCCVVTLLYAWPLLATRNSGGWDFLYIWDDRTNFLDNPVLQGSLSFENLYEMFTMVRINMYEPLGWALKFAVVKSVGLDAWWVRVVSVVVHFVAGFVLAKVSALVLDIDYVLTKLGSSSKIGLELDNRRQWSNLHFHACCMSAVMFTVHPIHVEVVGWPSAQSYTLSAFFSYCSLLVHVQNIHHNLSQFIGGGDGEVLIDGEDMVLKVLLGRDAMKSSLMSSGIGHAYLK
ncbi:unnamed protein product [Phytophthora fragariaefolia]|uniref:Unnamed protein product n=1 Tax=Phytophthora fragariaefolia TaxID=1490495 RepID=A0A9W6Y9B5_9STRA|nr:unnamed protein product [Phytophthora fragariaefolia]